MAFDINYITGNPASKEHWTKRAIAFIIDMIIVFVIFFIAGVIIVFLAIAFALGMVDGMSPTGTSMLVGGFILLVILISILTLVISALYFVIMDTKKGGTFGKRLVGLRVEALDGNMTLQKGVLRNLTKLIGILIGSAFGFIIFAVIMIVLLLLDVLMAAGQTDDPRQKYTDKIAGTIVVRTDIVENLEEMKYVPRTPAPAPEGFGTEVTDEAAAAEEDEGLTTEQRLAVAEYSELLGISEERALNLYNAGYKNKDDFKDAIVEDLIIVDKINPTIAKAIIKKMESPESD